MLLAVLVSCGGKDGKDAITPTIEISEDGYWVINGAKTEIKAVGTDGVDGKDGKDGVDGKNGSNGVDPTIEISEDGYWVINGKKTNVKASSDVNVDENPQGLQFFLQDDGTYLVACGDAKYLRNIEIPATYKGGSVVGITDNGFSGCQKLANITIPDSVISIGSYAFHNCTSLASVTIPDGVTSIDSDAFYNCTSLASVTIPDGVTSIGSDAFYNCTSLVSVTIPDSVTSIGSSAFYGCTSLSNITVGVNNKYYQSIDGNLYTKDGKTLIQYAAGKTASEFIIPDSVTYINSYAFYNCTSLASVTIPNSVTYIDSTAFYYCSNLIICCEAEYKPYNWSSSWNYSYCPVVWDCNNNDVATDGYIYTAIDGIRYKLYAGTATLTWHSADITEATIPSSITHKESTYLVTEIPAGAFYNCTSLTNVTIPDSVISIGGGAFRGCSNLENVYITDIAAWCGITFADYTATPLMYADNFYLNGEIVTDLVIPEGVTTIRDHAFDSCKSLTSITIPDSVTSIGSDAFCYCTSLTSVTIPDSVTTIGDYAFYSCTSLTSVTIPDSVTSIDYDAFYDCTSLSNITVGANNQYYQSIDGNLYTKDGKTLIQYAVGKTASEFIIPDSVTYINSYACYSCTSLTIVTIPDSVISIGFSAFRNCTSLSNITVGTNNEYYQSIDDNLYTKDGKTLIQYAVGKTASEFIIPDSVIYINSCAFDNCTSLTSVTIPNSVTDIGLAAFYGCTSLTSINFEGTVEQWNAICKEREWNYNVPATEVVCSDGTVKI